MKVGARVVVVTGGGSGIGAALARRFAAEGASAVVVADRDAAAAQAVAAQCAGVGHARGLDVTDGAATEALVAEVEATLGPIALFCANAGVGVPEGAYPADVVWQRLWQVHVMAHVHAARALVPRMTARPEGGWLLVTASAAGLPLLYTRQFIPNPSSLQSSSTNNPMTTSSKLYKIKILHW